MEADNLRQGHLGIVRFKHFNDECSACSGPYWLLIAADKFLYFSESIGCSFVDALHPVGLLGLGVMLMSEYGQEIISDGHPLVFFNDGLRSWNKWNNSIFRSLISLLRKKFGLLFISLKSFLFRSKSSWMIYGRAPPPDATCIGISLIWINQSMSLLRK